MILNYYLFEDSISLPNTVLKAIRIFVFKSFFAFASIFTDSKIAKRSWAKSVEFVPLSYTDDTVTTLALLDWESVMDFSAAKVWLGLGHVEIVSELKTDLTGAW